MQHLALRVLKIKHCKKTLGLTDDTQVTSEQARSKAREVQESLKAIPRNLYMQRTEVVSRSQTWSELAQLLDEVEKGI